MIIGTMKIVGLFILSFMFFSIEINNKPIFNHVYKFVSPTKNSINKNISSLYNASRNTSKELLLNSTPHGDPKLLEKRRAQILKKKILNERRARDNRIIEDIKSEDAQALNELIKKSSL